MKWGFFTPQHILTLMLAAAMLDGLYLWIRNKSPKFQTGVLFALSLSGVAAIVYNLLRWDSPLQYLPLHLCSLNAMVLPVAVLTRNTTLGNLLMVWCLGHWWLWLPILKWSTRLFSARHLISTSSPTFLNSGSRCCCSS
jgi:uncharacterized membrane protein YwaF